MTHSFKGKRILPLLVFVLCFAILLSSVATFNAFAAEPVEPVGQSATIKVAQISDIHYFPRDLTPWDYDDSNKFALENKQDFKLVAESGTMLNAACNKILEYAKANELDVLIASGDLTKDGEKRAHIDLANRLRKLQNDIRRETLNKEFQIFVIPGNHDTYNSDGSTYNVIMDKDTKEVKDFVLNKYNEMVTASDNKLPSTQKRYLLNRNNKTNQPINYLRDAYGNPQKNLTGTNYVDVNNVELNIDDISEVYETSHLIYSNKPIANTSNEEFVKIYSGLGYEDFTDKEVATIKASPLTSYTSNKFGQYNFNTPFMNFVNSKNAVDASNNPVYSFDYIYKDIKNYAADYVIDFFNLDKTSTTLKQKESLINANLDSAKMYKNLSSLGYCSYIAKPNSPDLQGYTFALIDSNLKEVDNNGYLGYEHATGGRISDIVFNWLEDKLVVDSNTTLAQRQETIISSLHHGTVPHFFAQEPFMNDFLLYNWEEQIVKLTNLGIQFTMTGHVHASDVAKYVADNGKEITDIVTGSIISYGAPIRFMEFTRSYDGVKISNKITDKVQSVTSLKNVPTDYYGYSSDVLETTTEIKGTLINDAKDNSPKLDFFNDEANLDKIQEYLYNTTMHTVIPNILEGYVNDTIFDSFKASLPDSDFGVLISEILDKLTSIKVSYLDGTEMNLFDFVYAAVYDAIGNEEGGVQFAKFDELQDIKFKNKVDPAKPAFSVHDLLRYSYTRYIINGEAKSLENIDAQLSDPSIPASDKLTLEFMASLKSYVDSGVLAKAVLGDPSTYTLEGEKSGLLYPLLYAKNNLIDQVLNYTFDFNTTKLSPEAIRIINVLFDLLGHDFEATQTFTLNQIIAAIAKDAASFNDEPGIAGEIISSINRGNLASDVLRDFINKYAVDNFFKNISSVLFDVLTSFGVQDKIGYTLNVNNEVDPALHFEADGFVNNGTIYESTDNKISINDYQKRGFTPSMLTLSYGKDAKTSMNLMWNTATFRKCELSVLDENGNIVDSDNVLMNDIIYGYPTFDLGLFAKNTNTSTEDYIKQMKTNGFAKTTKQKRVYRATIDGLVPGKTYTYSIKTSNVYTENETYPNLASYYHTVNGSFTTAKEEGNVKFLAVSDIQGTIQSNYEVAKDNIQDAIDSVGGVDFVVNGGDVVDNGNNIKQWYYALNNEDYDPNVNSTLHTVFSKYPTLVAAGNHEDSNYALANYFNIANADYMYEFEKPSPQQIQKGEAAIKKSKETGLYYSYKIANAKFIVLNTNTATADGLEANQYKWLINELQDEDGVDWKFVVMHKGLYSSSNHANDTEVKALRQQLNSVFYDYDVDIVLQGHDHTFTTSKFLDRNGNEVDNSSAEITSGNTFNRPAGVMYITLGTIADKYYPYDSSITYPIDESRSILTTLDAPTYCYFNINGKQLDIHWNSLNPAENAKLNANTMVIKKTRALESDADFDSITFNNGPTPVVITSSNADSNVIEVPYNFNLKDIVIKKGSNIWKKWTIEQKVEIGGIVHYEPIVSTANLRRGPIDLRIAITSEDGSNTKYVPVTLNVKNAIESKLGDLLKINGTLYTDGLKFSNLNTPLSMDIITNTDSGIVMNADDIVYDKRHNTVTYFFNYNGEDFMLYQKGYNLYAGTNWCEFILTDSEGNNLNYSVVVENPAPKDPTKTALLAIIGIILSLIVINIIVKLIRHGKGIFSFLDKYKEKNKDDYYIQ